MKNLKDILVEPSGISATIKKDWERQKRTAEEIASRFRDGRRTILVADEVGMGKTYVALAAMAQHIFQTDKNDRKVLLVVPTSSVLTAKWKQEILTFNETYLPRGDGCKQLRPLMVRDHWELVRNLHDFDNCDVERVRQGKIQYFSCLFRDWHNSNIRKSGKHWTQWEACGDIKDWSPDFLDFCSSFSPKIVEIFLSEWFSRNPEQYRLLIAELDDGVAAPEKLRTLFRDFARQQDNYEPNVFIVTMGMLQRQSRKDNRNTQLLCTYIVGRLMRGMWSRGKSEGYAQLKLCGKLAGSPSNIGWLDALAHINLWGLRSVVDQAIEQSKDDLKNRFFVNPPDDNDKLLLKLRDEILRNKLAESGVTLAVIDEVHNWKSGRAKGAEEFRKNYAPVIPYKLIMSATPFQIHENELTTVFSVATGVVEKSGKGSSEIKDHSDRSMRIVAELMEEGGSAKRCLAASNVFSDAWKALSRSQLSILYGALATDNNVATTLATLRDDGIVSSPLQRFCKVALEYRDALKFFEADLRKVSVRHTKNKTSRQFHNGRDFTIQGAPCGAFPRTSLYATQGYGNGEGALLDFIGMRAQQHVQKALGDRGSVRLLGGMNSSYEAFIESWSARGLRVPCDSDTQAYTDLFVSLLGDTIHPKVHATVERAVSNYLQGRKTLVFCERRKTQDAIEALILQKLKKHVPDSNERSHLRSAILRNFETVEYYLAPSIKETQKASLLLEEIPEAAVQRCLDGSLDLLRKAGNKNLNARQLAKLVDLCLVRVLFQDAPSAVYTDILDDPIALQTYLRIKQKQGIKDTPPAIEGEDEADDLTTSQWDNDNFATLEIRGIIKNIFTGNSIWRSFDESGSMHTQILALLQSEAQQLTGSGGSQELHSAPLVFAELLLQIPRGLRSVLLRFDTLPDHKQNPADFGKSIVDHLRQSLSTAVSTWRDTQEFLRFLCEAKGSIRHGTQTSRRYALWRGVFLTGQAIVHSLNGDTNSDTRVNLCAAFNSPLLPSILLCTSVGSEGIDLHLQCAEVIHHDLPWNPAKLEQRTGRVDRVGALIERAKNTGICRISIGIPFLFCNYDEFQYNTVCSRAQKQEVLLGTPDYTTCVEEIEQNDNALERVIEPSPDEVSLPESYEHRLPEALLNFLKVDLTLH